MNGIRSEVKESLLSPRESASDLRYAGSGNLYLSLGEYEQLISLSIGHTKAIFRPVAGRITGESTRNVIRW